MSQQAAAAPASVQPNPPPKKITRYSAPVSAWERSRERLAWLLIAPSLLVVAVVALYPLYRTFYLSMTNARLGSTAEPEWVGFRNYERLFNDSLFWDSLRNTVTFTVFSVGFETVLGMIIALTINSHFRGRGLVRTSMLIPWAIPTVVSATMWDWMYNDVFGVVNDFFGRRLGIMDPQHALLADPATSLWAIIAVDVWKTTPFMALLLLAGLQVIPGDIYEASYVDGASKWQQFWQMTLPLIRPALVVALIFRTMDAFRVFDVIFVMKSYQPDTMTLAVYTRQKIIDLQRLGLGSASSVMIFIFIAILVVAYTRLVKVEEG
jgi:trehalose/maltose transport system permease protein